MNNIRQHRPAQAASTSSENAPEEPGKTPLAGNSARATPPFQRAPRCGDDIDYLELLLLEFKL